MPSDNIIVQGLVQASNQNVPAVIRATQSAGVYTLVVSGAGDAITIDSQTTGNLVSWGAAGHIADSGVAPIATDTGWVANADNGAKGAVIPDSLTIDSIATAMNVLAAGSGSLIAAMADKIKALEYGLANNLRPNV